MIEIIVSSVLSFCIGVILTKTFNNKEINSLKNSINKLERMVNKLEDMIHTRESIYYLNNDRLDKLEERLNNIEIIISLLSNNRGTNDNK